MRVLRSASGLIIITFLTLLISIYWVRPLADDYCLGAKVHTFGFLGAVNDYFQTWSGDGALVVVLVALVGVPLSGLGANGFALIPFLAMFCAVMFMIKVPLNGIGLSRAESILTSVLLFISFFVANQYSSMFDKGYFADNYVNPKYFNLAVNSWSTIIAQYLFLPAICYFLFSKYIQNAKANIIYSVIIAIIAGTSGYALSATFLILYFLKSKFRKENILFPISLIAASAVSYFSKGARARKESIFSSQDPSFSFFELFHFGARQLLRFIGLYFNYGILVTFISAFCLGLILKLGADKSILISEHFKNFTYFVLVSIGVNAAAEYFTYPAFWHLIFIKFVVFLQVVLGSFYLVTLYQKVHGKSLIAFIVLGAYFAHQ